MTSDPHTSLWRASDHGALEVPALSEDLQTDLVVIGGGFTGCSAALEAATSGANVVLLEAQTIGHGGSGRNVGLVNAGLWLPPEVIKKQIGDGPGTRLINALSVAPDEVYRLIEAHNIDCEATRNGTLHLAHAPKGVEDLQERFRQGNASGAPLQLLDREETIRRTGSQAFFGALFDPRAGAIQPLGYCRGLARAALSAGARVFERSAVTKISHSDEGWHVQSNGRRIRARHLLLATNGYIGALSGAPKPAFVPFHYCQFATAPLSDAQRARILPGGEGCWDTALVMSSLRIDRAGRVIVGGVGNLNAPGAAIHRNWAARKLAQIYPELAGVPFEHEWEGTIAMTSDHLPKVVEIGPDALSVFGYSGRGIGPGTVFGKRAARALLFGEVDALPLDIVPAYAESLRAPRAAYYEFGATLTHAVSPNPLRTSSAKRA
ncbi:FAD-binding oxidoreductase [Phaeobacter sp. HF9A]|uniref:NAD(P)/FAD-dependent oxidoreductase n=1 Tax=Phaeobacter sp. HF9A TaxID=2721561 RepID=UPI0014315E94|nr:FAD-dependent oxidoreductase [Phaeobacter sp. HF9A]NIZ12564.1 FAD-binding oxidoreductase [Phaeobacter sp. HF9A]